MKTKSNKTNKSTNALLGYVNFKLNHKKVDEVTGALSVFDNNRQADQWLIGIVEAAKKKQLEKDFTIDGEAEYFKPKNKEVSHGYFLISVVDKEGEVFTTSKSILKNPKMANDVKLLSWFKENKKNIKKAGILDISMYPVAILSKKALKKSRGNFV